MRYPEFLQENGSVGFIAPSFGVSTEPYRTMFDHALSKWHALGHHTVLGPNVYESAGYGKSNTPAACGQEVNAFFTRDLADVILSCGGGETMCEDLPYINFGAITRSKPHWYMGYSDNTNLTFLLPTLCDTAAIYGPNAASFGMEPLHESLKDAYELLRGRRLVVSNYEGWELEKLKTENLLEPYHITEPFQLQMYNPDMPGGAVDISGRLIGGCLDCLTTLCGTKYDCVRDFAKKYEEDGIIWFLEACELGPMGVRRALWQLEQAGWFQHVKGFLIGRPMMYHADGMGLDRYSAVTGILKKYQVPILMDLDIGHLPPMMPVIAGACASIRATSEHFMMQYELR